MEQKKFSYPKTFLLGFGFFGVSVIWSIYNAFVPIMLSEKFGLEAGWIAVVMVLDNIAAILIQPPLGVWSDRLRTPIGRRLPFILVGAPLGAIAFGVIPLVDGLALFIISCITLLLAMAIWRTPVVALMPDITPSKNRSEANGVINLMGGLGLVLSTLIGSVLYRQNDAFPFWLGSILVVIAGILVFIFIKEPKEFRSEKIHFVDDPNQVEGEKNQKVNILKDLLSVFQQEDKSAMRIFMAILLWFISYNAIETFFTLYCHKFLGLEAADSAFQFTYIGLIFMLAAIPAGYLTKVFGRKKTIMSGIALFFFCIIALYFIPAETQVVKFASLMGSGLYVVSIFAMLAGVGWALININSLPMVVDMTDDEHIGTYTGLYYFFSQVAATVGPLIFGWSVQFSGNNYRLMMAIGPVFMLLAFISMMGVKKGEVKEN